MASPAWRLPGTVYLLRLRPGIAAINPVAHDLPPTRSVGPLCEVDPLGRMVRDAIKQGGEALSVHEDLHLNRLAGGSFVPAQLFDRAA